MTKVRKDRPPMMACAALVGLAGPLAAETIIQTGSPFETSGATNSERFNEEQNKTLAFDRFDTSLGTLTGVSLDYDLSSSVSGSFDYAAPGGGWNANTVVVFDWDQGNFRRENGDGDGNGGGGSDPFNISASLSGTAEAEDVSFFTGDGQAEVFLKYVYNLNGGPGTFSAKYGF